MQGQFQSFLKSIDLVLVSFLGLLIAAVFYLSRDYPEVPWSDGGSPGFYPRFLAVVLAGLALAVVVESWKALRPIEAPDWPSLIRVLFGIALLATAPLLLELFGFRLAATAIALIMMLISVDWRQLTPGMLLIMSLTAVGIAFLLGFAFEDLAARRLPRGQFFGW